MWTFLNHTGTTVEPNHSIHSKSPLRPPTAWCFETCPHFGEQQIWPCQALNEDECCLPVCETVTSVNDSKPEKASRTLKPCARFGALRRHKYLEFTDKFELKFLPEAQASPAEMFCHRYCRAPGPREPTKTATSLHRWISSGSPPSSARGCLQIWAKSQRFFIMIYPYLSHIGEMIIIFYHFLQSIPNSFQIHSNVSQVGDV